MQFNRASVLVFATLVVGTAGFQASRPTRVPTATAPAPPTAFTRHAASPFCGQSTKLHAYRQAYQYQLDLMTAGEIETQILDIDKEIAAAKEKEEDANVNVGMLEQQLATLQAEHEVAMSKLKEDMEEYKHREEDYVSSVDALTTQLEAEMENASTAKDLSNGLTITRVELESDLVEMKRKYEAEKWQREFDNTQAQEEIDGLKTKMANEKADADKIKEDADKLKVEIEALKSERKDPMALFKQGFKAMMNPDE